MHGTSCAGILPGLRHWGEHLAEAESPAGQGCAMEASNLPSTGLRTKDWRGLAQACELQEKRAGFEACGSSLSTELKAKAPASVKQDR